MRAMAVLALALMAGEAAAALAQGRGGRRVSCCLEVFLPDVTAEPRCVVVNFNLRRRLHVGRRLFCRLAGGRPVVHGQCTCD